MLTHSDAAAIAAQLPHRLTPAPGAGGLPVPRSTLEAMSMIAFARQQGVSAFWAGTPNTANGDVTMHWIEPGGSNLVYRQGERRCILIASGQGRAERMYAHLRPCDAKLADGVATVAAAAAPPPPPGATSVGYYDPHAAPPPPPGITTAAWEQYTDLEIRPRTTAICEGGLEGKEHEKVCLEMAEKLAKWQPVMGIGLRSPICHTNICWLNCESSHTTGEDDSFHNCPSTSCAKEDCFQFLKNECPPVLHEQIQSLYSGACEITPPSPPYPPRPPPSPPNPPNSPAPFPPPPAIQGFQRKRSEERGWDEDCALPTLATCHEAVRQFSLVNPGYLHALRVTSAPCEG